VPPSRPLNNLPWPPSFYFAHRTSPTEWLIGSNSGIFFLEIDVATSLDEAPDLIQQSGLATTNRYLALTRYTTTTAFPAWTVLNALDRVFI